ncbi:hypothetical protein [Thermococcus sp. P6]|uniref:hypothetical protein n=1 Tax=Thermococcus sp. P6 TaxID=122420 RepID=UPI001E49D181|nr:hypothetical protein [Thermococcus sp. P6]
MVRTIGWVLVLLGFLLLLREFHPSFLGWLSPYRSYIKNAFWGVTLVAFGAYLLARGTFRRVVKVLYLIYLILYLVV